MALKVVFLFAISKKPISISGGHACQAGRVEKDENKRDRRPENAQELGERV